MTITVSVGAKSDSKGITVAAAPAAALVINPANPSLAANSKRQLLAEFRDANGLVTTGNQALVNWSVPLQQSLITISGSGELTAASATGSTTVTSTYTGVTPSIAATTNVTVTPSLAPAASITVTSSSPTLIGVGGTVLLTALVKDGQGNTLTGRGVTWQSLSPAIADVDNTGKVTGKAVGGPVTIRASTLENPPISGDATVSVEACPRGFVLSDDFATDLGAGWTTAVVVDNPTGSNHTQTVAFQPTGGSTAGYRRMEHSLIGQGTMWVYHRREVEYDPSVVGNAIAAINYSEDQISFPSPTLVRSIGWGLFLEQGGNRYTKSVGTAAFNGNTWGVGSILNITAAAFSGGPGAPPLNFGPTGGKIKFGYYRANTSTSGSYTSSHGIDNWRVEVCRQ
ncbi:MAG: Ig-like domain-containing protein [Gemmatimonadaceae bacterium]|nr:Ig-like domain-containing protein [Gemmatimonadaceae bacterium]